MAALSRVPYPVRRDRCPGTGQSAWGAGAGTRCRRRAVGQRFVAASPSRGIPVPQEAVEAVPVERGLAGPHAVGAGELRVRKASTGAAPVAKRVSRSSVFSRLIVAWIVTIPFAAGCAAGVYGLTQIPLQPLAASVVTLVLLVLLTALWFALRNAPGPVTSAPISPAVRTRPVRRVRRSPSPCGPAPDR
ncbi:hypothetical protein Franean1_4014 [Parafrankia sp. EAN1pec]|nr:hypothetical protein Franean1_4014 [Frankia sp. EAN1pec]